MFFVFCFVFILFSAAGSNNNKSKNNHVKCIHGRQQAITVQTAADQYKKEEEIVRQVSERQKTRSKRVEKRAHIANWR